MTTRILLLTLTLVTWLTPARADEPPPWRPGRMTLQGITGKLVLDDGLKVGTPYGYLPLAVGDTNHYRWLRDLASGDHGLPIKFDATLESEAFGLGKLFLTGLIDPVPRAPIDVVPVPGRPGFVVYEGRVLRATGLVDEVPARGGRVRAFHFERVDRQHGESLKIVGVQARAPLEAQPVWIVGRDEPQLWAWGTIDLGRPLWLESAQGTRIRISGLLEPWLEPLPPRVRLNREPTKLKHARDAVSVGPAGRGAVTPAEPRRGLANALGSLGEEAP